MIKRDPMQQEIEEILDLYMAGFELKHNLNKYDGYLEATQDLLLEAELFRHMLKHELKRNSLFVIKQKNLIRRKRGQYEKN